MATVERRHRLAAFEANIGKPLTTGEQEFVETGEDPARFPTTMRIAQAIADAEERGYRRAIGGFGFVIRHPEHGYLKTMGILGPIFVPDIDEAVRFQELEHAEQLADTHGRLKGSAIEEIK